MAYKYRWLDQALDDMGKEIEYVSREFGIRTARRVEADVHERVLQLCQFPYSGMAYEGLLFQGNEVRVIRMRRISIIYCFQNETVTLIAIWNNYQNPEKLPEMIEER